MAALSAFLGFSALMKSQINSDNANRKAKEEMDRRKKESQKQEIDLGQKKLNDQKAIKDTKARDDARKKQRENQKFGRSGTILGGSLTPANVNTYGGKTLLGQ